MIIMQGELRGSKKVKTKKGDEIEILNILTAYGQTELIVQVANFSKQIFKPGKISLKVAPRSNVSNGRAFLNWVTYDGAVV